jgi:ribonuclease HI
MGPARTSTVVYTDGACSGNPGPGGWAWAVPGGAFASGAAPQTTNQRMEIAAALEAVRALDGPVEVVSDSTYVVNCFRDRWWEGWMKRGWLNSQKKPVANRDLWEPLIELVRSRGDVTFRWVKGHSGDPYNDLVDRLAVEAALEQKGRSGDSPPEYVGEPDTLGRAGAGSGTGAAEPGLPGHPLVVLGHRPPDLGGYEENPTAETVRRKLGEIFLAKRELAPELVVATGLLLGAETLGAQAALDVGVPYVVVLAYPEPQRVWPRVSQDRFAALTDAALDVITLQRKLPESKAKAGAALARRDAWLARHANEAVLVWDQREASLGKLYRSLVDHLGEEHVWTLEPPTSNEG